MVCGVMWCGVWRVEWCGVVCGVVRVVTWRAVVCGVARLRGVVCCGVESRGVEQSCVALHCIIYLLCCIFGISVTDIIQDICKRIKKACSKNFKVHTGERT